MDENQRPVELKQETSDAAAIPPVSADAPVSTSEPQPEPSQGAHHYPVILSRHTAQHPGLNDILT